MKKRLIYTIVTVVISALIVAAITYYYPRSIQFSAQGIQYQLGNEQMESIVPMEVTVDGKLIRKLNGDRIFRGSIDIPKLKLPVPEHAEMIEMPLGADNSFSMTYSYIEGGMPHLYSVGSIFINEQFSELTILLTTYETKGRGSWSQEHGMMLSAPATSREEALKLSNRLMKVEENNIHPLQ